MFSGSIFTLLNVVSYLANGLTTAGIIYAGWSLFLFCLEKIKTIGDAYMVAAGLPEPRADHTEAIAQFAVEMLDRVEKYEGFNGRPLRLRVGINTGPVVAGVIGRQKFIYDLWGDAVNVASRMESNGLTNQIQVTEAVKEKLLGQYEFVAREPIQVKGKGQMVTYLMHA